MNELSYKEEIEELKEESNFEELGDELYMNHSDVEARLEWAFYRPSGSHPQQVNDINPIVSIMAFNHSRLGALERFTLLHDDVIKEDDLRVKVRNRSRMLFRAMVDNDFKELVQVLNKYPVFFDLAYDQMINGRIWNEIYAEPTAASDFLNIASDRLDDKLIISCKRRLQPISMLHSDQAKVYLDSLCNQVQKLHTIIKEHFVDEFEQWIKSIDLHPLQKILWQKKIDILK